MERKEKEGVEIDLKRVLIAMMYRWWIIVLAVVLFGTAAFSYAWFGMTPVYSSNVKLYVNNNYVESPGYSSAQIMAAKDLAATYMVILESRNVLEEVSKRVDGRYTYEQLRSMVSASAVNETEVFQVTVTGQNYKDVAKIATVSPRCFLTGSRALWRVALFVWWMGLWKTLTRWVPAIKSTRCWAQLLDWCCLW